MISFMLPPMDPLVKKARDFATRMHRRIDHRRKYTNQPYDTHLKAVAEMVTRVTDDAEMVAAAWLHDVVEDTPVTLEQVRKAFGAGVAALVDELTDVSRASDGNRAVRKAIDREHSARASARAKTVKLADLLDNCRDIRRGDPGFARVFFPEAQALLPALREGDRRLHAKLAREIETGMRTLGISTPATAPAAQVARREQGDAQRRAIRVFVDSVVALDLAEPLLWFDVERGAAEVAQHADAAGAAVVGLRKRGAPWGYVSPAELRAGPCGDAGVRFAARQTLSRDARLRDVVHVLTRHESCFVTLLGEVGGVIRREHLDSPIVRMWLFGLITLIEMSVVAQIRTRWPDGAWRAQLSPKRVEKAEALAAERHRQGKPADLLDCLQFADKARVLVSDPGQRSALGYKSVAAADQAIRDIESLRNNLAHAQDIVADDWVTIARLAENLTELIEHFPRAGAAPNKARASS
jgi:hypothetical protein